MVPAIGTETEGVKVHAKLEPATPTGASNVTTTRFREVVGEED